LRALGTQSPRTRLLLSNRRTQVPARLPPPRTSLENACSASLSHRKSRKP
jgi:hypothetical protein